MRLPILTRVILERMCSGRGQMSWIVLVEYLTHDVSCTVQIADESMQVIDA